MSQHYRNEIQGPSASPRTSGLFVGSCSEGPTLGMMRSGTPIQGSNYKPANTWYRSTDHPQVHTMTYAHRHRHTKMDVGRHTWMANGCTRRHTDAWMTHRWTYAHTWIYTDTGTHRLPKHGQMHSRIHKWIHRYMYTHGRTQIQAWSAAARFPRDRAPRPKVSHGL